MFYSVCTCSYIAEVLVLALTRSVLFSSSVLFFFMFLIDLRCSYLLFNVIIQMI